MYSRNSLGERQDRLVVADGEALDLAELGVARLRAQALEVSGAPGVGLRRAGCGGFGGDQAGLFRYRAIFLRQAT